MVQQRIKDVMHVLGDFTARREPGRWEIWHGSLREKYSVMPMLRPKVNLTLFS
ncbi:hypothetical protein DPMN_161913 [Dreissena polymorpha]|uniref:Uncharacterized protein n=1 Tax=Dreissena polymorpha TaxID=45954 RepID=A0A9D4ITU2_DREPO|nr:hypothetical protein DPMN_161913 [Dreissena polymorpha]